MSLFRPKQILNRFDELNIKDIKDRGFKAVFIDIDNTITYPGSGDFTKEAKEFVDSIKNAGLIPVIFSNNTKQRVSTFVNGYDVDWYYLAMKPLPFAYKKACKKYNCKPSECVVIGDQLMTDILGANLSGCYGIYTKQLFEQDTPLTKINRFFERIVWKFLNEKV